MEIDCILSKYNKSGTFVYNSLMCKSCKRAKLPSWLGTGPSILLFSMIKKDEVSTVAKKPMNYVKNYSLNEKDSSLTKFPISEGIVPCKALSSDNIHEGSVTLYD